MNCFTAKCVERKSTKPNSSASWKISVSGSDFIIDSKERFAIRIIFSVALILSGVLCIFVLDERTDYFNSYPVSLAFEIIHEYYIEFPKLTLCAFYENPEDEDMLLKSDDVDDNTLSIDNYHDIFFASYYDGKVCDNTTWKKQHTAYGPCYTLAAPERLEYIDASRGFYIILNNFVFDFNGRKRYFHWKMLIHEHMEDAVYGVLMQGHDVLIGTTDSIFFAHKKFKYEDVPTRHCTDKADAVKCLQKCYDEEMSHLLNCKMPYISTTGIHLRLCDADEAYSKSYFHRLQEFVQKSAICICHRPCIEDFFEVRIDSRDNFGLEAGNQTSLYIVPLHEEIEIMEEQRAYSLSAFICDIGGTLGLYLGICILAIIEMIYLVLHFVFKGFYKN